MLHLFTRDWKNNNKKQFQNVEIGDDILIYISIKRIFQIEIDFTIDAMLEYN